MSPKQITKKLIAAGIAPENILEVRKNEVEVGVLREDKTCEYDASEALCASVMSILDWKHAMKTGYNSWIVEGHENGFYARRSNEMDQFGAAV